MGAGVPSLPPPIFVNDADGLDPNLILADVIAAYQTASGKTLQPAQPERLFINSAAYREALVRNAIQWAAQQNLLAFATYPMLDYLGQLVGVTRLAAQPATATIQFTLAQALTVSLTLPAGTQAGTQDGQNVFATNQDLIIQAGATSGSVLASAQTPGPAANGYANGQISILLSPNAFIASVTNTSQSSGGSDPETDAHLQARIQIAPNQYSVAGPADAYRYFTLSADPSIVDAQVISPAPGQITVYILIGPPTQPASSPNSTGIAGSTLLAEVLAALSADTVRPLNDTVTVLAVTEVDYQIQATVIPYADADGATVLAAAQAAVNQWAQNNANRIQRDIVPESLIAALTVPGVYRATALFPAYTQLAVGQWANCTAVDVVLATAAGEDS